MLPWELAAPAECKVREMAFIRSQGQRNRQTNAEGHLGHRQIVMVGRLQAAARSARTKPCTYVQDRSCACMVADTMTYEPPDIHADTMTYEPPNIPTKMLWV